MKKSFIFAAILLVAATTITIVSCQKDQQEKNTTKNVNPTKCQQESNMDAYLLAFKDKLLNATKGGETISFEQARYDLCNLLNFDFGDASYATDVFQCDTLYVPITITDGMVELSQLAVTYSNAIDKIQASYKTVDLPDKSVYSIFCEYNDTESKDGDTEMRIIVNYRGSVGGQSNNHDTLSWHPGTSDGCCDDPTIQYGGATVMQYWLDHASSPIECLNGSRLYYTEVDDWYLSGNTTFDATENRYRVFTEFTFQIDTVCISHEDMEYYYSNIIDYLYGDISNDHVITMVVVSLFCIPNPYNYPGHCWYWRVFIRHGKPNCTDTNPIL